MPRYLVQIREELTRRYTIPVEASSPTVAMAVALGKNGEPGFVMPEPDSTDYGDVSVTSVDLADKPSLPGPAEEDAGT